MAAPAQVLQFPLSAGVDEGSDPKTQQPGKLSALQNLAWRKDNRLDKRFGTEGLSKTIGGSTLANARRFAPSASVLGVLSETATSARDGLADYSEARASWRSVSEVPPYSATWSTVVDEVASASSWDVVVVGNYEVITWVDGDPLLSTASLGRYCRVMVRDAGTGAIVVEPTLLSGAFPFGIRLVVNGTNVYLVGITLNDIVVATISLTAFTVSSPTTLRTDAAGGVGFVDAMMSGGNLLICYQRTSGASRLALYTYTPGSWAQVLSGSVTGEASTSFFGLAIGGPSNAASDLYVFYYADTSSLLCVATLSSTTLAVTSGPTTVETAVAGTSYARQLGVLWISSSEVYLSYTWTSSGINSMRATSVRMNGTTLSTTRNYGTWGAQWVSRPGVFDGRVLAMAATVTGTGGSHTSTREDPRSIVALELPREDRPGSSDYVPHRRHATTEVLIGGWPPNGHGICQTVTSADGTSLVTLAPFQGVFATTARLGRQGLRRVELSTAGDDWGRTLQVGPARYIVGGTLCATDGIEAHPVGFAHPPSLLEAVNVAGGAMGAGTYTYAAVFEYRDATGLLHRSPLGTPVSVSVAGGATASVRLKICTASLDHHQEDWSISVDIYPVLIAIYRTEANGTTLYRHTIEPVYNANRSDARAGIVTYTDALASTAVDGLALDLDTRPLAYTTGGILPDRQPPSFVTATVYRKRIWGISGDRRTVWFSKSIEDDFGVAPAFHENFRLLFEEDLTALGVLDEKLVIFSATKIWFLQGDGPNAAGQQSDFAAATQIQSDVGCVNPKSVVVMPSGLLFESARGIYALTRGLELSHLGKPVEDTLSSYPTITSAVLVPIENQVRFTANNAAGTAGVVLVFDYLSGQWSRFVYTDTVATPDVTATPIADACIWNDRWTFVTPTGSVMAEDSGTHLDGGSAWVYASGTLSQVSAAGPLGYQRVRRAWLLGELVTDCDLTLFFDFDGRATFPQSYTWASDKLSQFGAEANVGMRVGSQNGASPRSRSFTVRWSDGPPTGPGAVTGTGQGCNFSAFGLEIVPQPGLDRRTARART